MAIETDDEKCSELNPEPTLMETPMYDFYSEDTKPPQNQPEPAWEDKLFKPWMDNNSHTNISEYYSRQSENQYKYGAIDSKLMQDHHFSTSWKAKHPEQWSADDVTLWICSLMNAANGCPTPINIAVYLNITGAELVRMTCTDLQRRDQQSGIYIYMALQYVLAQMSFSRAAASLPRYEQMEPTNNIIEEPYKYTSFNRWQPPLLPHEIKEEPTDKYNSIGLHISQISFDPNDDFHSIMAKHNQYKNTDIPSLSTANTTATLTSPRSDGSQSPNYPDTDSQSMSTFSDIKGNHLWEFIRDLLLDSRYNPTLVKWEDREEGIFKFVKSDQVAKLWGKKKNNPAMTYEKLSRAMRYYYKRKILERIDGRRLVYKFGSMATGWRAGSV